MCARFTKKREERPCQEPSRYLAIRALESPWIWKRELAERRGKKWMRELGMNGRNMEDKGGKKVGPTMWWMEARSRARGPVHL
jgi:hypothetical protein